jgi:hypothetical protein
MYCDTKAYYLTFATGANAESMKLCCYGMSLKAEMRKNMCLLARWQTAVRYSHAD